MTLFPFQVNEVMHLYNRVAKLKPSAILEKDQVEPQDFVNISAEAKKRQVLEQTRSDVIESIRGAK